MRIPRYIWIICAYYHSVIAYDESDRSLESNGVPLLPPPRPNSRELSRVSQFDTSTMDCEIGVSRDWGTSQAETIVPFWYAVGSRTGLDSGQEYNLEQKIFFAAVDYGNLKWCTSAKKQPVSTRRRTEEMTTSRQSERKLYVYSINSAPLDVMTNYTCPENVMTAALNSGADNCTVHNGLITIVAQESDDVSYLAALMRDNIEGSMIMYTRLLDLSFPDVTYLAYLGDTPDDWQGGSTPASGDGRNKVALAVAVPILSALIFAALLMKHRRRMVMTTQDYNDMVNSNYVLTGTADPPGSHHDGLYHHLSDGTRYLSTRCEQCIETRQNSFYTDDHLGTIIEDQEYDDDVDNAPFGLGARKPTMDVHNCTSATCDLCGSRRRKRILFCSGPFSSVNDTNMMTDINGIANFDAPDHMEV